MWKLILSFHLLQKMQKVFIISSQDFNLLFYFFFSNKIILTSTKPAKVLNERGIATNFKTYFVGALVNTLPCHIFQIYHK